MALHGYVSLFNNTGDGLGIASAATVVDLDNRHLSIGNGTLDAAGIVVQDTTTASSKVDVGGTLTDSVATAGGGPVGLFVHPSMSLSEDHASPGQLASVFIDPIATASTGTQTLGAVHGLYVHSGSGTPAVAASAYGVYVKEPTVGTANYSAYFEGKVGVKTATPSADLHVNGSISATTVNGITMTPSGNPVAVGSANSAGVATTYSRLDHVHDHGSQSGGALHADATTLVAGFMSAADKVKLDGMVSTASFEQVSQNLADWDKAFAYTGDDLTTITYTKLTDTIVKTFNYSLGKLITMVLSGDTPGGIPLTKTFTYSGDTLTDITYS